MLKALLISSTLLSASVAIACPKSGKGEEKTKTAEISVDHAAKLAKAKKVIMVDANSKSVRKELGVVPGARLLSSYSDFKVSELKAKKSDTLVFYCHSKACSAAPAAAEKAQKSGFKTKVMSAGITGWRKAGHKVQSI